MKNLLDRCHRQLRLAGAAAGEAEMVMGRRAKDVAENASAAAEPVVVQALATTGGSGTAQLLGTALVAARRRTSRP